MRTRAVIARLACLLGIVLLVGTAAPVAHSGTVGPLLPEVSGGRPAGPGAADKGQEMADYMRQVLGRTDDPVTVAGLLQKKGATFLGYQAVSVRLGKDEDGRPVPVAVTGTTMGPDLAPTVWTETVGSAGAVEAQAGRKDDFLLRQWLYEWKNANGTWTEENAR